MQFYYVTRPCTLTLPHKVVTLHSPSSEALQTLQIPLRNIYCGNVAWEIILTRSQLADDAAIVQESTPELEALLPPFIQPWSEGRGLIAQIQELVNNRLPEKRQQPFRIALINGVGTMLGDTLVGSSALEIAAEKLRMALGAIEIHAVLAWNARPGAEGILSRSPAITSLQEHSITLEDLRGFDAYFDFSVLLRMEGYDNRPLIDFYLQHFAIAPESIAAKDKLPVLRLPAADRIETKAWIDRCRNGRKLVLIQGLASTQLRSMPEWFFSLLLADLLNGTDACILLTQPLPNGVQIDDPSRFIQLADWCAFKTENFLSLFAEIDVLISVDTLAIHAAMAERKPGVAIFTTIHPELRLSTVARLKGFLIPGAQDLPLWGKHKEDGSWAEHQPAYNAAWQMLDRSVILEAVRWALDQPKIAMLDDSLAVDTAGKIGRLNHTFSLQDSEMSIIKIDNKDYEFDQLSEEAKAQLASLQFVDAELQRLNAQAAVLQTARMAYAKGLSEALAVGLTLN